MRSSTKRMRLSRSCCGSMGDSSVISRIRCPSITRLAPPPLAPPGSSAGPSMRSFVSKSSTCKHGQHVTCTHRQQAAANMEHDGHSCGAPPAMRAPAPATRTPLPEQPGRAPRSAPLRACARRPCPPAASAALPPGVHASHASVCAQVGRHTHAHAHAGGRAGTQAGRQGGREAGRQRGREA